MNNTEYSLFNASDGWVLHYIDDIIFDESLLLNILFQDRILMHESYFFNSQLLSRHIKHAKGQPSLFECAAKKGLIIPAVRDLKATSLENAYELLIHGSLYKEYQLLSPELQPYKDRVVGAVDAGLNLKNRKLFYWPNPTSPETSLGHNYLLLIRSVFQKEAIPRKQRLPSERHLLFNRVWEKSKSWRYDCIEEAAERTQENGNQGVQRVELLRSLGWKLGIPRSHTTIEPQDILSLPLDPEMKLSAEIFIKWLAQCHHLSQARLFNTSINFPVYDLDEDFLLDSLFAKEDEISASLDDSNKSFRCTVELPPLEVLISLSPENVVAIRDDLGEGYRTALKRWQESPTNDNRFYAIASLRDYCKQISLNYEKKYLNSIVAVFGRTDENNCGQVVDTAANTITSSGSGLFLNATKLVFTAYQFYTKRKLKSRLSPISKKLEVNLIDATKI